MANAAQPSNGHPRDPQEEPVTPDGEPQRRRGPASDPYNPDPVHNPDIPTPEPEPAPVKEPEKNPGKSV